EIKDSYHLLPFDVRPGQYMNTWSKIDRDTVIEYSFKQNDKNHHLQFIVLLQDDSLSKRVGEIIASYNNNKS
ncbi:C80 family cysteine peptidase, partial [Yersinia pestis]